MNRRSSLLLMARGSAASIESSNSGTRSRSFTGAWESTVQVRWFQVGADSIQEKVKIGKAHGMAINPRAYTLLKKLPQMALSPKINPDEFRHVTRESQLGFACSHFGCLFQVGIDPESENLFGSP